jgi:hypothetical protein
LPPIASSQPGPGSFMPSGHMELNLHDVPRDTVRSAAFAPPPPMLVYPSPYYKPTSSFIHRYPVNSLALSAPLSSVISQNASLDWERERRRRDAEALEKRAARAAATARAKVEAERLAKEAARAAAAAQAEQEARENRNKRLIEEGLRILNLAGEQTNTHTRKTTTSSSTHDTAADGDINEGSKEKPDASPWNGKSTETTEEPNITLVDALGRKLVFPWRLAKSWNVS